MSAIQAAGPFLVAALLLMAGSIVGRAASRTVITQHYGPALAKVSSPPTKLLAPTMRNMVNWAIDAAQLLGVLIAPAVGLVFFFDRLDAPVAFVYTVILIVGFVSTFVFVTRINPVNYGEKKLGWRFRGEPRGIKKWKGYTPVTIIGVAVNLAAGLIAALLTLVK